MFEGAHLKLQRANEHIQNFCVEFEVFVDLRPHRSRFKGYREADGFKSWVEIIEDHPIPDRLSLILGDAIHNLRTAIDHAVWELFGFDGATQNRYTKLPTGNDRVNYESSARGMKTPVKATTDFLVALAVYPEGDGRLIYGLHMLDNADKHTVITTVAKGTNFLNLTMIKAGYPDLRVSGVGPGLDRFPFPDGWNPKPNERVQATPAIFFGEVDIFPNQPIIPTLVHLSNAVADTLGQFQVYVASRTETRSV